MSHMLRPWVAARNVRDELCRVRPRATARGKPAPSTDHFTPLVRKTPISVATYKVLGKTGSITIAFTGMFGRLLLMLLQVTPLSVVRKTCPLLNPDKHTYAVVEMCGSTATWVTNARGKPVL